MRLRLATIDDKPRLLEMTKKFITLTPYSEFDVDEEKLEEIVTQCLDYTRSIILVYTTDEDEVVGMLAATTNQFLFNRELIASEMAWWVDDTYRGRGGAVLRTAFEHWARYMGAKYVSMSSLNTPSVDKMLHRAGYTKTECTHVKEL